MNAFDSTILTYLNSFADHYPLMDLLVTQVHRNNLLANAFLMAAWWYCWFQSPDQNRPTVRGKLWAGLLAMLVALLVTQIITHIPPLRVRPFANPDLHFVTPGGIVAPSLLKDWSSFPSDHAALWFSAAATLYLVNKPLGGAAFAYAFLLSLFRVYNGHHYPTDILVGAAIGVGFVQVCNLSVIRDASGRLVLRMLNSQPGIFYVFLFLCTYQISNTFNETRGLMKLGWDALKLLLE